MSALGGDIVQEFDLSANDVNSIAQRAITRMNDLLACNGAAQIPSFVTKLPNGSEKGHFLTVDLGGTYCRVCLIHLQGNSRYELVQSKAAIPGENMVNPRHEPLFDFIATMIKEFLQSSGIGKNPTSRSYKLAFTFSFTYETVSLRQGVVLQWDKGWDIPDAIGKDPCDMLQRAIERKGLDIEVCALTSDSVSTLVAEAFQLRGRSTPLAGIIFGTGTNAAYIEKQRNIAKLNGSIGSLGKCTGGMMVINSEWGGWFDTDPRMLPQTTYDQTLDHESSNPNKQLFEKMVSGLYIAELLRLVIVKAVHDDLLTCTVHKSSPLHTPYSIDGLFLTLLAKDNSEHLDISREYISKYFATGPIMPDDARLIRSFAIAIVRRSARLSGAAIAALLLTSGRLCEVAETAVSGCSEKSDQHMDTPFRKFASFLGLLTNYTKGLLCPRPEVQTEIPFAKSGGSDSPVPDDEMINIGVDGSLFEFYPTFEIEIRRALRDVQGIGKRGAQRVIFRLTRDGSSLGAALIAHSAI
ncbi:hypothetical protein QQS21_002554 [Conoideocrella luteorostrata]|uniref:Phosphotransferase n=1 Tax=Conoideocrella luteorostrata TaxID=1105319 RepID=A0AAJ0G2U3_9HYPO|nr:hypothetical protein QQS21_002554 [Conoideocrella luteorostrata]